MNNNKKFNAPPLFFHKKTFFKELSVITLLEFPNLQVFGLQYYLRENAALLNHPHVSTNKTTYFLY